MATPSLRLIRDRLPGIFIGALMRPGIDQVLAGTTLFDEVHAIRRDGVMGPKFTAAKVRPRRYDTALLFTNSFSTALVTRIAGIPRRIGYDRDARGLLLTDRLRAPTRPSGDWAPVPAVDYYWRLARYLIDGPAAIAHDAAPSCLTAKPPVYMELATTPDEDRAADEVLGRAGLGGADSARLAILNPGGNNPAKRWPAERFAALADHLATAHRMRVLVNGSPDELGLADQIAARARHPVVRLPAVGITLGSLKALVRRSALMITNDTGPRHIAAALNIPVVSLFGPTDHRWTTIPARAGEAVLVADPTLPETEVANDHPERCRIDRIEVQTVISAVERALSGSLKPPGPG